MAFDCTNQWDEPLSYAPSNTMDSEDHRQELNTNLWDANIDPSLRDPSPGRYEGCYTVERYLEHPQKVLATIPQNYSAEGQQGDFGHSCTVPGPSMLRPSRLSPEGDSFGSSALSPPSDQDFLVDGPFAGSHPLSRSVSALSHHSHSNDLIWPDEQDAPVWSQDQFDVLMGFDDTTESETVDAETGITGQQLPCHTYSHPAVTPSAEPPTPPNTNSRHPPVDQHDSDPDSEAEDPPAKPDVSDTDPSWQPSSSRQSTARRRPNPGRATTAKAHKPKPSRRIPPSSTSATPCNTCRLPFGPAAMTRHVSTAHGGARAYPCAFAFAGCASTFAAKNEWKRHVASQHLGLAFWRCDVGGCGRGGRGETKRLAEFNRKDLFTQHVRRMHPRMGEALGDVQARCRVRGRAEPRGVRCPVPGCGERFGRWDARMEHVGLHLVRGARGAEEGGWWEGEDEGFVAWAAREGIVERVRGGWALVKDGWKVRGGGGMEGEEDAEGEDEYE